MSLNLKYVEGRDDRCKDAMEGEMKATRARNGSDVQNAWRRGYSGVVAALNRIDMKHCGSLCLGSSKPIKIPGSLYQVPKASLVPCLWLPITRSCRDL